MMLTRNKNKEQDVHLQKRKKGGERLGDGASLVRVERTPAYIAGARGLASMTGAGARAQSQYRPDQDAGVAADIDQGSGLPGACQIALNNRRWKGFMSAGAECLASPRSVTTCTGNRRTYSVRARRDKYDARICTCTISKPARPRRVARPRFVVGTLAGPKRSL